MKRIFTIIMIGILLVGCAKTDFLTEHDWVHYGSTCIETIYFGKDGHFAYYSDEGNPVNDSDLYGTTNLQRLLKLSFIQVQL